MKFLTNKAELDIKDFQQILTAHQTIKLWRIFARTFRTCQQDFFIGKPVAYTTQESEQFKLDNLLEVFRFKSIPSEEMILALDFVEIYDDREIKYYDYSAGRFTLTDTQPHYFDDVPIIEYPNNRQHRGDFENVLTH